MAEWSNALFLASDSADGMSVKKHRILKNRENFHGNFFGGIFWNEQNVKKMSDSWLVKIYNDKYKR